MKLVAKLIIISLIILQIGLQADTKNFDIQNVKVTKYKSIQSLTQTLVRSAYLIPRKFL